MIIPVIALYDNEERARPTPNYGECAGPIVAIPINILIL